MMEHLITHNFKDEEIIFEKTTILDITNLTDNDYNTFTDTIKNNSQFVNYSQTPSLFEFSNAGIKYLKSKFDDKNNFYFRSVYKNDNNSYIHDNEIIIFFRNSIQEEFVINEIENLILEFEIISNVARIKANDVNDFEKIRKILDQKGLLHECNWQTLHTVKPFSSQSQDINHLETRSLPPNPAYNKINFHFIPKNHSHHDDIIIGLLDMGVFEHHDIYGYFIKNKSKSCLKNYLTQQPNDGENHGMKCAGILISFNKTKTGLIGTGAGSKLISYKIAAGGNNIFSDVQISNFSIIKGFLSAYNDGCSVINCSWSLPYKSAILDMVINFIVDKGREGKGIPVIFAAGNNGVENTFPANHEKIIAVSGTDLKNNVFHGWNMTKTKRWKSNYGVNVLIAAPAEHVFTLDRINGKGDTPITYNNHIYYNHSKFEGTSASCPIICGVIAQILRHHPDLTLEDLKLKLRHCVNPFLNQDNIPTNQNYGCGVVDFKKVRTVFNF